MKAKINIYCKLYTTIEKPIQTQIEEHANGEVKLHVKFILYSSHYFNLIILKNIKFIKKIVMNMNCRKYYIKKRVPYTLSKKFIL